VLRTALIDARVMHAGLSNKAKGDLVELFNNLDSSFKVLIMMYDVGAVGLNLQFACDRVFIASRYSYIIIATP
jgi:SNF2 family DNA or RNA helicase